MRAGAVSWSGLFVLDVGRALYVGPGRHAALHAHHALQVCVGLEGPLKIRGGAREAWTEHHGCVIAPGQPHEFDAEGRAVTLLFVEPEGSDGRRIAAVGEGRGITNLDMEVVHRVQGALVDTASLDATERAVAAQAAFAAFGVETRTSALDARVRRAVEALRQCRREYPGSSEMAATLGLSPGRFRHLWLAEVGLAYRRYLLWLRLQAVLGRVHASTSLTEAAHEAGFADSAHLARTFRRLLGITPSSMPLASGETEAAGRKGSTSWAR